MTNEDSREFLIKVKEIIHQLEKQCLPRGLLLLQPPGNGVIYHNPKYHWQWKRLAKAIRHYRHALVEVDIRRVQLTQGVLQLLRTSLEHHNIESLRLSYNYFGSDGVHFMTDLVRTLPSLNQLWSVGNRMDSSLEDEVTRLSAAIGRHSRLQDVKFQGCGLGNTSVLSAIIQHGQNYDTLNNALVSHISSNTTSSNFSTIQNIRHLGLRFNQIWLEGAILLSNHLATNPPLQSLDLSFNQLNDDAIAHHIARALRVNTHLRRLELGGNEDITMEGKLILRNVVYDTSSLNAVLDSNHTVSITFSPFYDAILTINKHHFNKHKTDSNHDDVNDARQNRKVKCFLTFRNEQLSNLGYFEDLPVELMPYILKMLQKDPNTKYQLNNVFEIVRNWKMPQLFLCLLHS